MADKERGTAIFISPARFKFLAGAFCLGFAALAANLCYIHMGKSEWCEKITERVRNRFDVIDARRGDITDSRGNLLATSRPIIELGVDPEMIRYNKGDLVKKLRELAEIVGVDEASLFEKCGVSNGGIPVARDGFKIVRWRKIADNLDSGTYARAMELKIKGIYGNRKYVRVYPSGALTAHTVGFVNKEFTAVCGIENQFDYYLRGQNGFRETERDGKKRELVQFRTRDVPPQDGMKVELSIDLVVQEMAHREMKRIVDEYNPKSACIIVSDPSTGYILALSSYPNFDPNNYNKYPQDSLRNRAICDVYEPGSTFKIVSISAALNEALVGPEDSFDCKTPTVSYRGRILRLPKDTHVYDSLTVREIAKKSSNRGVAHLAVLMGENTLYDYARKFGYGKKTDLGLTGERDGILAPTEKWDGLTITRLPMGHAIAATPLQVHCAMCVLANQGIYMKPQLVKRVSDESGKSVINFPPKAVRRVVSPKIAALMSEILSEVTETGGTATKAHIKGFKVAGKTGTSQKIVDGKYSSREHIASFSGFFPAQRPRLAITVVVDTPHSKGVGYGGTIAAPAFSNIAVQAADYLGIKNDEEFSKMIAWRDF